MQSVLKVASGRTAILGGLMLDSFEGQRDGLPVASRIPILGDFFSYRNDTASQVRAGDLRAPDRREGPERRDRPRRLSPLPAGPRVLQGHASRWRPQLDDALKRMERARTETRAGAGRARAAAARRPAVSLLLDALKRAEQEKLARQAERAAPARPPRSRAEPPRPARGAAASSSTRSIAAPRAPRRPSPRRTPHAGRARERAGDVRREVRSGRSRPALARRRSSSAARRDRRAGRRRRRLRLVSR